jgi:hypothetical protein
MATAPRTVNYVLTQAIYTSLQDAEFQAPIKATYQETALLFLQSLCDEWRDKVPFAQQFQFNNVDELADTQFTSVQNVNFILSGNNQVPLERSYDKDKFYNIQGIIGLQGIPEEYYFDELTQTILVYPTPNQPSYSFIVWGRPQLYAISPEDVLPDNMPYFMVTALIYEIAFRLCARYGVTWSADKQSIRDTLSGYLNQKKTIDLRAPIQRIFKRSGTRVPPYPYFYQQWGFS